MGTFKCTTTQVLILLLASAALTRLVPCVTPFLRSLRAPRHAGAKHFIYKHGTTTTSWGKR